MLVVVGPMRLSGIDYDDFALSAANTMKAVVAPLLAGAIWLIAFLHWARWRYVFRDGRRLPMTRLWWALPILMAVVAVLALAGAGWRRFSVADVVALVLACILVGFTEETLFRGVILRSLRQGTRSEAAALGWTTLWFGAFHLTNLLLGEPGAVVQVVLAGLSGVAFYVLRRGTGVLLAAMVLHGLWDFSTFIAGAHPGEGVIVDIASVLLVAIYPLAALVLILLLIRSRHILATRAVTEGG